MDLNTKLELLDKQIVAAKNGHPDDFTGWQKQTEVIVRTLMGQDSPLHKQFKSISYSPAVWYSGMDTSGYRPAGVKSAIAVLEAAKLELKLTSEVEGAVEPSDSPPAASNNRVFIVHGHDETRMHELARLLQGLTGEEPTILHEQANGGRVLMEKFEQSALKTGFAVVLLTADDFGRAKDAPTDQPRGRQNVVFEMGFFFGALGRDRVAVLYDEGVEIPSDISGLVYIALDHAGGWKAQIARELEAAGLRVEWSALRK